MGDPQHTYRVDEGGGGRFEAIAGHTDMDLLPENGLNNKRDREKDHETNESDNSRASKPRLDILLTNNNTGDGISNLPTHPLEVDNNTVEDVSKHLFIIELIGRTKEEITINDEATLKHMLRNSQLRKKSTGIPRFLKSTHRIILHIID